MKIITLLSHASELFRLVMDSEQQADQIASKYFRSKKYIGSGDRKFLSGLLFHTLRNLIFVKSISETLPGTITKEGSDSKYSSSEMKTIVTSCLVGRLGQDAAFNPDQLLKRFYKELESFDELWVETLSELFSIEKTSSENLIAKVTNSVESLDNLIDEVIYNKDMFPNEKFLQFIEQRYSVPVLLGDKLYNNKYSSLSRLELRELAAATVFPADIFIRCNSRRDSRDNIHRNLLKQNIETELSDVSPVALKLNSRTPLNQLVLYKKGLIEPQDAGSQIVSYALSPAPKASVLDACAGAGGKTLHIANLQNDRGTIYACDTEFVRLKEVSVRSKRYKYKSIKSIVADDKSLAKLAEDKSTPFSSGFDYILIDAPCSGTGTIRRSPLQKFKITNSILDEFAALQFEILEKYSRYLKPGGVIVYATCSMMSEENDAVVERFMTEYPEFSADPLKPVFAEHRIIFPELADDDFKFRLMPSVHNCDGFFMARMKKRVMK